jgi:hypothetical protein
MKPTANKTGTDFTLDPLQDEQLLHYVFSPLEINAFSGTHDPVLQPGQGKTITLPPQLNQELAKIGQGKLRLLSGFISGLPREPITSDPHLEKFLYRPLIEHGLPTRLYHLLLSKECKHMHDVIRLGMPGIRSMRGIGKGSMDELQRLLEHNGCNGLLS